MYLLFPLFLGRLSLTLVCAFIVVGLFSGLRKEKKVCDCCPLRPQHAPWNPNSGEKKTRACTFCHPKMCDCWLCPECLKYNPFADTICGGCKVRGASFADSSATSQQGKDAPKVRKDRWFDNWCEKTEDDVWWISDLPQIECNLCTSQKCLCWECPHCFKKNRYGNTCIHCHVCKTDWKCQCKSKFWRAQDTIVCIRCTTTNPKHVTRKTLFGKLFPSLCLGFFRPMDGRNLGKSMGYSSVSRPMDGRNFVLYLFLWLYMRYRKTYSKEQMPEMSTRQWMCLLGMSPMCLLESGI